LISKACAVSLYVLYVHSRDGQLLLVMQRGPSKTAPLKLAVELWR